MKKTFVFVWTLFVLANFSLLAQFKVIGYVPNWIDLNSFSQNIDYDKLTHINIAFENPVDNTGKLSYNAVNTALINTAHDNNVKIFISLGGGSASSDATLKNRYFDLISASKRTSFIQKISDYLTLHNFDGVDVDLEGPAINKDYGHFISELVRALHPQGKLVSAALSSGFGGPSVPDSVLKMFDWVNMMSYDATGPWNPSVAGQHSSYTLAVSDFNYWTGRGLPAANAMVGLPFYGYGFGNDFKNEDYNYAEIVNTYAGAENLDKVGSTIYYNGIPTIKKKTTFAVQKAGGVMIWEISQDATGEKSLLTAIDQVVHPQTNVADAELSTIKVFPNPATSFVTIQNNGDKIIKRIDLLDLQGRVIQSAYPNSTDALLKMENVSPGIYIIKIYNDLQLPPISKKVVVK